MTFKKAAKCRELACSRLTSIPVDRKIGRFFPLKKEKKIADDFSRQKSKPTAVSQLVLKCKINVFFLLLLLFRSPAGRLATGWLPRMMQSEKRLRGNTFCEDPDSAADGHGGRSVSSR